MCGYICSGHSNAIVMLCVVYLFWSFQCSRSVLCGYICSGHFNAVVLLCVGIFVLLIPM